MPFYEYECSNCRFYVEVLQKISEQPLRKCPSCGKNALKKLVSAPVFRLKGSGWYETDFKSDQENKRNLANAEKEGKEAKPAEAEAKADTEPEAKAEGKEAKAENKADSKPASAAAKPAGVSPKTATRSGNKSKSKGAARGKSAGSKASASSRSKSSAKRRRGR
jgi:putative FmdB family regulatory protein